MKFPIKPVKLPKVLKNSTGSSRLAKVYLLGFAGLPTFRSSSPFDLICFFPV